MTLRKTLEKFDKEFNIGKSYESRVYIGCYECGAKDVTGKIKDFISTAIKDALEACRVEKEGDYDDLESKMMAAERDADRIIENGSTWNANTTQYDENVLKFMGDKD